jgi:hypothetical protein
MTFLIISIGDDDPDLHLSKDVLCINSRSGVLHPAETHPHDAG